MEIFEVLIMVKTNSYAYKSQSKNVFSIYMGDLVNVS